MNKAQFLQEKTAFHMKHPDYDDLTFYRSFVERYPDETVGWLHLGREWERRGLADKALEAIRKSLHTKASEFSDEARSAYHELLRNKRRQSLLTRIRRGLTSLLFLYATFVHSPFPLREAPEKPVAVTTNNIEAPPTSSSRSHVEVIAVPDTLTTEQLGTQVSQYLKGRRPSLTQLYSVIIVPEAEGIPLYTPLLFYKPTRIKGLLRYNPVTKTFMEQTWFDQPCTCEQDQSVRTARTSLEEEQRTLEQVLILRNALYRSYQRKGQLPAQLADLAGSYPTNALPGIPQPLPALGADMWEYNPAAFRPAQAWESLRDVIALPQYPEPLIPPQPLQMYVHQASFTMTLMSGQHMVRLYPIGVGKEQRTPEGYFSILQKISRPRGKDNVYGTRGLVISSEGHAIHGTDNPKSIGGAQSLGCIRMNNADVEELYTFVSPGTDVIISDKKVPVRSWPNPAPFQIVAGPDEETPKVLYHWLY